MKTIIIHRKSSTGFLDQYRVLFQPFLESGQIDFCFWDENARDFASALPDLPSKIRGEKEWQAIVALPVEALEGDGTRLSPEEKFEGVNPFDFDNTPGQEPALEESGYPLVRLAQMLGGVPPVTAHVLEEFVEVTDDLKGKHTVLCPTAESREEVLARQLRWQALSERYSTNCVLPSRLFLFKGRVLPLSKAIGPDNTDQIDRFESDSSLFWYRNAYPPKARYLTKTFSRPGHALYHEDLFAFWMTVLTLGINEFPTGTFEAYKLYDTQAVVSTEILQSVLSRYYHKLDRVRYSARMIILEFQKNAQLERVQDTLPAYRVDIPVQYRHVDESELKIQADQLGLANDCPKSELFWWNACVRRSRQALDKVLSSIRPVLDRASLTCRSLSAVSDEELVDMDEYQVEEMEEELSALETEILCFNKNRTLPVDQFHQQVHQRDAETATRMRKHLSRKMAIVAGCVSLGLYTLGYLPELIHRAVSNGEYAPMISAFVGLAALALVGTGVLFWFRHSVRVKVGNYNGTMQKILDMIRASGKVFSEYLSKCCSYMRGRSLLQVLTKRAMISISSIRLVRDHSDQLKDYLDMIQGWISRFNLSIDEREVYEGPLAFDFEIPPSRNREYQLHSLGDVEIITMADGSLCTSPYPFVVGFQVVRVPLFDERNPHTTQADRPMEMPHDDLSGTGADSSAALSPRSGQGVAEEEEAP